MVRSDTDNTVPMGPEDKAFWRGQMAAQIDLDNPDDFGLGGYSYYDVQALVADLAPTRLVELWVALWWKGYQSIVGDAS